MSAPIKRLSQTFAAGALGGLINSLTVWLFGKYGLTAAAKVAIAPTLTPAWLYPRIVWGGIWGFLFLLPLARQRPLIRPLLLSLGPSLVQLLFVFPYQTGKGWFGLELGLWTPAFILLFNAVWGVAAGIWLKQST